MGKLRYTRAALFGGTWFKALVAELGHSSAMTLFSLDDCNLEIEPVRVKFYWSGIYSQKGRIFVLDLTNVLSGAK